MKPFFLLALLFLAEKSLAQSVIWGNATTKKYGISDPFTHEPITPDIFDEAKPVYQSDTLVRVKQAGRAGLVSATGRTVVPIRFAEVDDSFQAGLSVGFVATKSDKLLGLWHIPTGRMVLPQAFEWVRGIWPDLVAGRRPDSQTIEFFDEKGQKQFELPGKTAWPGFDEATIQVFGSDPKVPGVFFDKKGQPVFSATFKNGQWTDGSVVVVAELAENRTVARSALLTTAGDTLLPMDSVYFMPVFRRQFFVLTVKKPQKMGLFDAENRRWLFPMEQRQLMKMGPKTDPSGAFYSMRYGSKEESRFLFDSTGKQVAEGFMTDILRPEWALAAIFKNNHRPERYFVAVKNSTEKGLFASDGRAIVPMEFSKFEYASEAHPVIVEKSVRYGDPNPTYNAFDLKTGRKLFAEGFQGLWFTTNPRRFIARKNDRYGIVEVGKEAAARFDFERLTAFPSLLFWGRKGSKYHCIKSDGSLDDRLVFDDMYLPNREHFEKFNAQKRAGGRLIALGRTRERPKGFYYMDDRYQKTFIEDPTMGEMQPPTGDERVEEVVIEEPPMVEEMPRAKPQPADDEVFTTVEKQPQFPGGEAAMVKFVSDNLKYPVEAKKAAIRGSIYVQFIVEKDGSLTSPVVLRDIGGGCGAAAIEVIKRMPRWSPAMQNGQVVRAKFTLPIKFKL